MPPLVGRKPDYVKTVRFDRLSSCQLPLPNTFFHKLKSLIGRCCQDTTTFSAAPTETLRHAQAQHSPSTRTTRAFERRTKRLVVSSGRDSRPHSRALSHQVSTHFSSAGEASFSVQGCHATEGKGPAERAIDRACKSGDRCAWGCLAQCAARPCSIIISLVRVCLWLAPGQSDAAARGRRRVTACWTSQFHRLGARAADMAQSCCDLGKRQRCYCS